MLYCPTTAMMRRIQIGRCLLAVCLIALAACSRNTKQAASPPAPVRVIAATKRTVAPMLKLAGIIAPLQNVGLSTSLQEPTDGVYVNEGDVVHRGQVLAQLNTADLSASLAQAQAHLEQMRYQATLTLHQGNDQVQSAQAALDLARADLTRDEQLLKQGYISVQTVDTQRTNVAQAQAALNQAIANAQANGTQNRGMQHANVDQAAAAVDQIEAQIVRASITSPIDGVVVNRNLNPGEYPGTRQIFTLQEVSLVYAELNAYGTQVAGIRQGSEATLTVDALRGRTFVGRVNAILSPTTPSASGFIVKVVIPNNGDVLRPGMTIFGNVRLPEQNGIAVPVTAFLDETHQAVMIVEGDTAHVARVTEVTEDARYAIVNGLPAETEVVANGQTNVTDGEKVVASL